MAIESRPAQASIVRFYRMTHERLLKVSEELSPEQFFWSAGLSLHSVGWQLWHSARWDDFFAGHLQNDFGREPRAELWQRERLAQKWSFDSGSIGRREAGTGMDDAAAEKMVFPAKTAVVDYARRAFEFAIAAISAIGDEELTAVAKDDPDGDTYMDNILIYYEHLNRHLGMIEAIRGLQGLSGSATR